jgi:hypothetical protein
VPAQTLTAFGPALDHVKSGGTATRQAWLGDFLAFQPADPEDQYVLGYIFITSVVGFRQPWTATHADLLAEDWIAL